MPRETMERLWILYGQYIDDVERSAELARQAFGFQTRELLKVHHLTRDEFDACVRNAGADPETKRRWLKKILAFAENDEERRLLGVALNIAPKHPLVPGPHFDAKSRTPDVI